MEIGKKIRELRIARNLTQEALAAELSVTPQAKMDNRYDKNINYHGGRGDAQNPYMNVRVWRKMYRTHK